eukprot:2313908-Prymnesium_polylepis.2
MRIHHICTLLSLGLSARCRCTVALAFCVAPDLASGFPVVSGSAERNQLDGADRGKHCKRSRLQVDFSSTA